MLSILPQGPERPKVLWNGTQVPKYPSQSAQMIQLDRGYQNPSSAAPE